MEFLNDYILPVVLGICLCIGYIIKQWANEVNNKYIPAICAVLGIAVSGWVNEWSFTPQIVLSGLISGLASTGMHQLLKQFLDNK
jgi:Na+/glutamate symporter